MVGEFPRHPEREGGGKNVPASIPRRVPGQGGQGPVANFLPRPGGDPAPDPGEAAKRQAATLAWRMKNPPTTPAIIGGIEEVRVDEPVGELYAVDSYLGGRIMVFDLNTMQFKRGWGAKGKPLAEISLNDEDHEYTPGGADPKDFVGHVTVNISNDGFVYAADRRANRIDVTTKDGKYIKSFMVAPQTPSDRGAAGGVAFSADKAQRHLIISDMANSKVWFLDRQTGKVVGSFGTMGDQGGMWFGLHMIDVDSQNNIYTGEVFAGQRIQRFVPADSARGKLLEQLSAMKW
jgi:hypothetical protein